MTEDYDDELQRSKVFTNFRMCANLNIFFYLCGYWDDLLLVWQRDEHRSSRRTELTRSRAIAVVEDRQS